jgi:prepilin-type N-terminal cleavage/methylation domain-containing protein
MRLPSPYLSARPAGQSRDTRRRARAFTLIEVLVVMSIIAVLAGLLLTSLSSITKSGDDTKCVSNLRQVAMAVNAYASDNDDTLPGPLYSGQFPFYTAGSLSYFLVPYLGLSKTNLQWAPENSVFVCPSFARAAEATPGFQSVTTYGWIPNYIAANYGDTGIRPWGYPLEPVMQFEPNRSVLFYTLLRSGLGWPKNAPDTSVMSPMKSGTSAHRI